MSADERADLVLELRLLNAVSAAFLDNPGLSVFQALPDAVGSMLRGGPVLFSWREDPEHYAVAAQRGAPLRRLTISEWSRLPGEGIWAEDLVRLDIDGGFLAVPLRDKDALVGFIAIEERLPVDAPLAEAVRLLRGFSSHLQAFCVARLNEVRQEALRRRTAEAFAKSEKRLRNFIEGSKDTIFIADGDGSVMMMNRAGEELFGVPRTAIVGKPLSSFCPFALDYEYFLERLRADGFVRDFELTLMRPGNRTVFTTASATLMRDDGENGKIEIHGILRDISERLQSQRDLWQANIELAEMNERLKQTQVAMLQQEKLASIGQLAAGIAHEINNPLGFLMSNIGTLKTVSNSMAEVVRTAKKLLPDAMEAPIEKYNLDFFIDDLPALFDEMEDGFKRISEIVKNLRSFARSSAEEGRVRYDLNEGVARTMVIARNETRYVADVETDLRPLPAAMMNAGEINQVLLNLLVNAAQAIASQKRKDRGHIFISTRSENGKLALEVADDGPGIPESELPRIFEPFYTTKDPGKGTGLGLSISWDIVVRKHGGTIEASARPGGGTLFRVVLPAEEPADDPFDE